MQDQETKLIVAVRSDRAARPADLAQAAAAIIATTRRAWLSQEGEGQRRDEAGTKRLALAHPLVRFALDEKRTGSWRARVTRLKRGASVEPLMCLRRAPRGAR